MERLLAESRVIVTLDGEQFQLNAVSVLMQLSKNDRVEFFKFAAQCTPSQQPCDKSASFRIFKSKVRASTGIQIKVGTYEPAYMKRVEQLLLSVDPRSRRTFIKFFRALRDYLHLAFSPKHITGAFADTGLMPYDPVAIMRYWPHFGSLTGQQSSDLMAAIRSLSAKCRQGGDGYILNSAICAELHTCLPEAMLPPPDEHVYEVNRWNAAWLNNASPGGPPGSSAKEGEKCQKPWEEIKQRDCAQDSCK